MSNKATNNKKSESAHGDLFIATPVEVQTTHTEEIVIALCGPIGTPLHRVAKLLQHLLNDEYAYECNIIRLSEIIEDYCNNTESSSEFERIIHLIDEGNELRKKHSASILADLAISKIASHREKHKKESGNEKFSPRRVCHIIDSIKNQEELDALRLVYRDMLYFIGVYSPMPFRENFLENKGKKMQLSDVYNLIDRDSGEEIKHGQTVKDTFPHADFFLRVDSDSDKPITSKLSRLLHIIFDTEIITPTSEETAMYYAASAAGNSACMSRQVGAAITDARGEIISIGWNDVPKANGGLYMFDITDPTSEKDERCIHKDGDGVCMNDKEKDFLTNEIVDELIKDNIVSSEKREQVIDVIRNSKIKSLIEFSRSVHAEMHAIIQGSQLGGDRVRGGKLFCTTYPCHSCARHIVLAGIKEVYYIEPYRKSLAIKLHADSITEVESEINKVRLLQFDGVSPERYLDLFRMKKDSRKDKFGKKRIINKKEALPKCEVTLESLPALEALVVQKLISNKVIDIN